MLTILMLITCLKLSSAANVNPCNPPITITSNDTFGYYWKDYFGVAPPDAFPAGKDEKGKPVYIGQAYLPKHGLLLGTLYPGCPKMATTWFTEVTSRLCRTTSDSEDLVLENYIQILCTNLPSQLHWKRTRKNQNELWKPCHFIEGGVEGGITVLIGRIIEDDQTIIGKAMPDNVESSGLWIPGDQANRISYEILVTNC